MQPISSQTAYITPADFLARKDQRSVGQYCSFDGQDVLTYAELVGPPVNVTLAAALNTASGALESAVLTSQHYAVTDLQALDGMSLEYMKTILSDIAMYEIVCNRPTNNPPETVSQKYQLALQALQDLSDGKRIFAFQETADAGLPKVQRISPFTRYFTDGMVTARMNRGFGQRYADRTYF